MESLRSFDVLMQTRIAFGVGRVAEVGTIASNYGKNALLVTYKDISGMEEVIDRVERNMVDAGLSMVRFSEVEPDPPVETVNLGAEIVKKKGIDVLVGLGGGSAIDTAKAIGVIAVNGGSAWDYVMCNPGRKNFSSAMPVIAIPTTSGTGSEVTPTSVLTNKEICSKGSISNPAIFAKVAIVDPELASTMPPMLTALTGIDALGHAMEAMISKRVTPFVERLAPEAIRLIWQNLPLAYNDGKNMLARANMAWASTIAGMMLAQSGIIAVHAVSHALGAYLHIPHGLGIALATPVVLEFNRSFASESYIKIAKELGIVKQDKEEIIDEFIQQVKDFFAQFNIPSDLKDRSKEVDRQKIIDNAMFNSPLSLSCNPRQLSRDDMEQIISKII